MISLFCLKGYLDVPACICTLVFCFCFKCFYCWTNWTSVSLKDGIVVSRISINKSVIDFQPLCCSVLYTGAATSVFLIDFNRITLWAISFKITVGVVWLSCNKPVRSEMVLSAFCWEGACFYFDVYGMRKELEPLVAGNQALVHHWSGCCKSKEAAFGATVETLAKERCSELFF